MEHNDMPRTGAATLAKDVMHRGCVFVHESMTVFEAARIMARDNLGALPVCSGGSDHMVGIVTDRDLTIRCIARGLDPAMCTVGSLCRTPVLWVRDSTHMRDVVALMEDRNIRRVPVIDRHMHLVGMISRSDVAAHASRDRSGEFALRA